MEIVFCTIAFALLLLVLAGVVFALRRGMPRWAAMIFVGLAVVEAAIWFIVPQFPRRIRTALRTNIAETSPNPEFPELRTRIYSAPPNRVVDAVKAAISSRPGDWAIVSIDANGGRIHATKKVLMFTDDVFVDVAPEKAGARVDVRSQSRVGKGDFGENRRHIAWLLENVDRQLR